MKKGKKWVYLKSHDGFGVKWMSKMKKNAKRNVKRKNTKRNVKRHKTSFAAKSKTQEVDCQKIFVLSVRVQFKIFESPSNF